MHGGAGMNISEHVARCETAASAAAAAAAGVKTKP